jgi:hypothetical protein
MPTAINPETGEVLVLAGDEWVKPDQVAKNNAGESAYLVKNQWVLPGQNYQPPSSQGIFGKAIDYVGDQASILKKDVQIGLINTELAAKQAALAEKINLQEGRIGEFGPIESMPEEERKKHQTLQKSIEKDLLDVASLSTNVRNIQGTGGRKSTEVFQGLPQQQAYKDADFLKKAAMTGEAFIKDPLGISTDIGLQSLPQSLAVAATAMAARLGQINPKATAMAGGAASAMSEFGGIYADLREKGLSHKDAWEQAGIKSGVVGLFDAASFHSAGNAMSQIAKDLSKGSAKGTVKEVGKEVGKQAGLGAAGEALGSTTINQDIDPVSVLSEAVGEVFGAPGEALSTYRGQPQAAPTPGIAPINPSAPVTPTPAAPVAPPSASQRTDEMMAELENPVAPEATKEITKPNTSEILNNAFMWRKDGVDTPIKVVAEKLNKKEIVALVNGEEVNIPISEVVRNNNWLAKTQPTAAPEVAPITPAQVAAAPAAAAPIPTATLESATTIPVPEINEAAAGQNNFAFMDKGEVKSIYGDIVKKDGKEYIQYKNDKNQPRQRLLTNDVIVNPTPDNMELLQLYKAKDKAEKIKDNFIPWLKKYGVRPDEKSDMGIEKSDNKIPVGIFRKGGYGLDDLALAAINDGVLTESDLQEGVGGADSMRNLIYDAIYNQGADTVFNMNKNAELNSINQRIQQLETALEPAPEEAVAEQVKQQVADTEEATTLPVGYSNASMEQKAATERGVDLYRKKGYEANVIYQNGDVALAQVRKKNGDFSYIPVKKDVVWSAPHDIDSESGAKVLKSMGITDAQKVELLKAKEAIEAPAAEKHAKTPFLVIKPGITGSAATPKYMVNVARGWAKMLSIKGDIHIMTKQEAIDNADQFTGPHRAIGYMGRKTSFGMVRELLDGSYVIIINPGVSKIRTMETIAHELGHIHEWQVFNSADVPTRNAIVKEFNAWFRTHENISAKELVESMRPKVTAQQTAFADPMAKASTADPYWRNFAEWYADQVSRWATSNEKPLTVVDKFFKKLADALKAFYKTVKGGKFLPTQTMKEFLDGIASRTQIDEIAQTLSKGQMALFAKDLVESYKIPETRLPEKMSWGIGGMHKTTPINKPSLWHDTSGYNAADLIQEDLQYPTRTTNNFFVTDNPDLALGQRGNTGVLIEYDGYNVSGKEHKKPMTGDLAGREYVADAIAKNSIKSINVKKSVKLPLKALVARDLRNKFDIVQNPDGSTTMTRKNIASQPEQISEAKSKIESAPPKGPRNIEGEVVSPIWSSPEATKMDNIIYKLQDKHIDTKRVIEAINKEVGQLDDKWNVYLKEELYHGRTSAALRKFLLQELMPVIKQMSKIGISPADMKAYLHNRHATERNDQIAKIRPATLPDGSPNPSAMTDGGSGLTYKQIKDYFDKLDPVKAKKLEEVAKKFDEMITGTQKILVDSGIEQQSTIDSWNKAYKNYVPLFREDDDFASHPSQGTGKGFATSGATSKRAMGSTKGVQDILGNILGQRERALVKAEKVRVGHALYGLSIKNPNPEFWLPVNPDAIKDFEALAAELDSMGLDGADIAGMMQEIKKPEIVTDRQTGLQTVRYKINPLERYKDHVFPVRINGKDRYIFFNQNDPRAKRMVESMKNLDTEQLGAVLGIFGRFTRWFSAVNTQYNPVFGGINLLRDVQGAAINLSSTKIAGEQTKVLAGVMPSMRTIFKTLKAERNGRPIPDTDDAKLWEEFKEAGGQTLYRDSLARKAEEKQLIEHELERMKRGPLRKAFSASVQLLSDFNDTIENAVRLSAYKVAIDKGLSKEQAASIAKNLTVNFDRKGQLGSRINALWAFFNASMQGSARLYETMKGPAGRKILAGGITLGAIQAVALALAGFDEDEPPEFIKERNLIIPLGGKKYAMIPMPLGLHFFPNIGRITTEWAINDFKKPGKHVANLFGTAMDAFNPLGSSGLSLQTLAPTVADPLLALDANKDAFGRPIYKKDQTTNPSPGYSRSREGATAISKLIAEFLNYASGGTKYQKGAVSPTGDEIDYLVGQFTGGVGREIMKVQSAVESQITGEELPPYRVPIAGRFIGDAESKAADSQRFYENVTMLADFENEIKGRQKNRENVAEFMRDNPQARLWMVANTTENQISQLNKQRKELLERNAPKERIKQIENRKQEIMRRFNDRVKALEP